MPVSYKMQALQFGSNNLKVPGHTVDIIAENQPAPIPVKIADPNSGVWDLVFSFEAGGFYLATDTVPGVDGATITAGKPSSATIRSTSRSATSLLRL